MKLLKFSSHKPFRAIHVLAVQLNTASEKSNYVYCVNSVRWLDLAVCSLDNSTVNQRTQVSSRDVNNIFQDQDQYVLAVSDHFDEGNHKQCCKLNKGSKFSNVMKSLIYITLHSLSRNYTQNCT